MRSRIWVYRAASGACAGAGGDAVVEEEGEIGSGAECCKHDWMEWRVERV